MPLLVPGVLRGSWVMGVLALGASVGIACSEASPIGKSSHLEPRGPDGGRDDAGPGSGDAGRGDAADAGRGDAADAGRVSENTTLAAGLSHTCAVWPGGTVRCWGNNDRGELGDGTLVSRWEPTEVLGLTGMVEVAGGTSHSCALGADGTVHCWGYDNEGQLGDGDATVEPKTKPVKVLGLVDVIHITAGSWHTCALLREGTVRCWGWNRGGEVGDGTTVRRPTRVEVPGLTEVTQITAGEDYTCALRRDRRVVCWGSVLGGSDPIRFEPTLVDGLGDVVEIAGGHHHVLARRSDGSVRAWGRNTDGELGDGSLNSRTAPVDVQSLGSSTQIAAGGGSCARIADARVFCWGRWDREHVIPFEIKGLVGAAEIAAGLNHGCARLFDGTLRCWGYDAMVGGCCHDGLCGIPEGASCGTEGTCAGRWCSGCGGAGQPCCDNLRIAPQRCRDDTPLCKNERCSPCGGIGEPCCEGKLCQASGSTCFHDECVEPGLPGTPCLPGNVCPGGCCVLTDHSDFVCATVGAACPGPKDAPPAGTCQEDGSCGACGGAGQPCCPSASTRIAFYCSTAGMGCGPSTVCSAM